MPSEVGTNDCDEAGLTMFIGHKYLYERGVLHRDISPGNILIKWRPGSETTSGCLIDLDHAKRGKLIQDEVKTSVDDKIIDRIKTTIHSITCVEVEKEVARLLLQFFSVSRNTGPTITYFENVLEYASTFRSLKGQVCTPEHLRWKQVWALSYSLFYRSDYLDQRQKSFDFDFLPTERRKGSRTVRFFALLPNNKT